MSSSASARLFVALDLPEPVRGAIVAWRAPLLAEHAELRPVAAQALHVTLVFLGSIEVAAIETVAGACAEAAVDAAPVVLGCGALAGLPSHRPRLVALELADHDRSAATLQAALARQLRDTGLHRPERRSFWPHLTLARLRRGQRAAPIEPPDAALPSSFQAAALTLYRSRGGPAGARYEALWSLPLA